MHIVSFDPGKLTGFADWEDGKLLETRELTTEDVYTWCAGIFAGEFFAPDVIVCEAYVISQRTVRGSAQPWSLELIGLLRFVAYETASKFELQQASAAKSFATNDRLKANGFWHVGGEGHANDALRHLVLYLVKARLIEP